MEEGIYAMISCAQLKEWVEAIESSDAEVKNEAIAEMKRRIESLEAQEDDDFYDIDITTDDKNECEKCTRNCSRRH